MLVTSQPIAIDESVDLLRRARAGEAEAFCQLAKAHEQRLFRQAVALCSELSLAEDLTAEALVAAWQSLARFDGTCRFSTWLYAILLHRYQKAVRKAKIRPVALSSLPPADTDDREDSLERQRDPQPPPDEQMVQADSCAHLRKAIAVLPEIHQQVVWLRFFEAASLPEIAAALGVSVGTVKSRLHYALEKLRENPTILNLLRPERNI